nr:MAG TPA: hypothetical protein [Caudoviricetes sp.]
MVYPRARPPLKNALYSLFIAIAPQPPRRLFHPRQNQVRRFKDFLPLSGRTMRP